MYYGLMRISELAANHAVKACDIHSANNKDKILLVLHSSKTHGLGNKLQNIKIESDQAGVSKKIYNFSPFTITEEFLQLRGNYINDNDNLMTFRDNTPVRPKHVRSVLRKCFKRMNLNPKLYDTHSFRIGRATDLMKYGYTLDQIKYLDRWRSNTVFKYIRN